MGRRAGGTRPRLPGCVRRLRRYPGRTDCRNVSDRPSAGPRLAAEAPRRELHTMRTADERLYAAFPGPAHGKPCPPHPPPEPPTPHPERDWRFFGIAVPVSSGSRISGPSNLPFTRCFYTNLCRFMAPPPVKRRTLANCYETTSLAYKRQPTNP